MRWTRQRADERCCCGRRSRVVLTPRRWCQAGGGNSAGDGVNKPITGESTKETVKTIARGMPGEFRRDRGDYTRVLFILHTRLRARWAPGIPCAL
jgi:hypothetical protein